MFRNVLPVLLVNTLAPKPSTSRIRRRFVGWDYARGPSQNNATKTYECRDFLAGEFEALGNFLARAIASAGLPHLNQEIREREEGSNVRGLAEQAQSRATCALIAPLMPRSSTNATKSRNGFSRAPRAKPTALRKAT